MDPLKQISMKHKITTISYKEIDSNKCHLQNYGHCVSTMCWHSDEVKICQENWVKLYPQPSDALGNAGRQIITWYQEHMGHVDGFIQERRNSIANALELRLSCINPSMCSWWYWLHMWTSYILALFQYEVDLSCCRNFNYKDKTISWLPYIYNGNTCSGEVSSLYWNTPYPKICSKWLLSYLNILWTTFHSQSTSF